MRQRVQKGVDPDADFCLVRSLYRSSDAPYHRLFRSGDPKFRPEDDDRMGRCSSRAGAAVAYVRRAFRQTMRRRVLRVCEKPEKGSLRVGAEFLFFEHRQIFHVEPCHKAHDRRFQRSDGIHDDHPYRGPLSADADLRDRDGVYHQLAARSYLRGAGPDPRIRALPHHQKGDASFRPRFQKVR